MTPLSAVAWYCTCFIPLYFLQKVCILQCFYKNPRHDCVDNVSIRLCKYNNVSNISNKVIYSQQFEENIILDDVFYNLSSLVRCCDEYPRDFLFTHRLI